MSVGVTVLKALAATCSVTMILSSTPAVHGIHKNQSTGSVALLPLVGLWLNCYVAMLYGWATGSYFPIFATYAFGTIVSMTYLSVYTSTGRKPALYTVLGMTGMLGKSTKQVGTVLGYVLTVVCLLPYVGPFETIKTVLKTRSGASIPFGMCLAGATSNTIWTIEGLLTGDMFVLFISVACAALALFQVALCVAFRPVQKAQPASVVDCIPP